MAKRSDTGETLILALELLKRIPKNSYVTTKQLHEQLTEISVVRDTWAKTQQTNAAELS
ncbi:MAG: hypothetical protein AB1400_06155 [Pseudomonadota bacterium]